MVAKPKGRDVAPRGISNLADRNSIEGKKFLHVADGIFTEMKDACGEDSISFALEQYGGDMLELSRAAAGDNWNTHRFADAPGNLQIEAGFCAVGINTVQHDFACAEGNGPFRPLDGIQTGGFAAAVGKNLPLAGSDFFRVNRNDDALAPEFLRAGANQVRIGQGC